MGDKEVEELLVVKHCTDLSELGGEPVTFCYNCRRHYYLVPTMIED